MRDCRDKKSGNAGSGLPFPRLSTLKRYPNLLFSLRGGRKKRRGGGEGEKYQRETVEGVPYLLPLAPSLFSSLPIPYPFRRLRHRLLLISPINDSKKFSVAD